MRISYLKTYLLVLNLIFGIASSVIAYNSDDVSYRYLTPLSTNLKPENFEYSDQSEVDEFRDSEFENRNNSNKFRLDSKFFLKQSKSAMERIHESRKKAEDIEREILKRTAEEERRIRRFLAELEREQRKHFEELEREERKHSEEMEREYRKHLKELEKEGRIRRRYQR